METKNSKMFEKFIKDSFENHEVPYTSGEWSAFEKKFDKALKHHFFNKLKYVAIGTVIIASLVAVYFINSNNVNSPNTINKANSNSDLKNTNSQIIKESVNDSENSKQEQLIAANVVKKAVDKSVNNANSNKVESNNSVGEKIVKSDVRVAKVNKVSELENQNQNNNSVVSEKSSSQSLTIDVNKTVICESEEVSFFSSMTNPSYDYLWNFGDENSSTKLSPVHEFNTSGIFDVKLSVKDKSSGKVYNSSVVITVNRKPDSKFDYEVIQEGMAYPQVRFFDKSSEALNWEWKFGDEKISYEQNPLHVYFIHSDMRINVSMTAINVNGCKSKVEKTIDFKNVFDIMAPNAFSPDGDGLNDYFIPKALELYDIPFEMFIYDRAGALIFNTKTKSSPWDGRVAQTGLIPETGTFIWIVVLKDNKGKDIKYSGTVSIIK